METKGQTGGEQVISRPTGIPGSRRTLSDLSQQPPWHSIPIAEKLPNDLNHNTLGGGVDTDIRLNQVYVPSDDIVARDIEGELIIVPLVAGIGDMEDELFSLNDTGKEIWRRLDGKTALAGVATALATEYSAQPDEIESDVIGLVGELVRRKMLIVKPGA
jgi:hypothetical protein